MHDFNFFINPNQISGDRGVLSGDEFVHCCRVLRKSVGDEISLLDGNGCRYDAKIETVQRNQAEVRILTTEKFPWKIPVVRLGIGIVKNKALEQIISQVTALGVSYIYPIKTDNSIKDSVSHSKLYRKVIESAKQSGAPYFPEINEPIPFCEWLEISRESSIKLVGLQEGLVTFESLTKEISGAGDVSLLVGPESGFTEDEIAKALENGYQAISVSINRLRSELAATLLTGMITAFKH